MSTVVTCKEALFDFFARYKSCGLFDYLFFFISFPSITFFLFFPFPGRSFDFRENHCPLYIPLINFEIKAVKWQKNIRLYSQENQFFHPTNIIFQ